MLTDYRRPSIRLVLGGVPFTCGPPTVETILLFLGGFGPQLRAVAKAIAENAPGAQQAGTWVPLFLTPAVIAPLGACCRAEGQDRAGTIYLLAHGLPDTFSGRLLRRPRWAGPRLWEPLLRAVVACSDLPRLAERLAEAIAPKSKRTPPPWLPPGFVMPDLPDDPDDGSDAGLCLVALARAFGCSPTDVLDWSFLAFRAALDDLTSMERAAGGVNTLDATEADAATLAAWTGTVVYSAVEK